MDPDSGKMHRMVDGEDGTEVLECTGEAVPRWYIKYRIGELLSVKGGMFRVHAIRSDALILKPEPAKQRGKKQKGKKRRRQ